ncbi:MAG: DUF5060 domain-containing protein, partial [Phycisphaerae bacterium]|nr:DUF5060 domain-containing protein [Phycisphaerae bacterium]
MRITAVTGLISLAITAVSAAAVATWTPWEHTLTSATSYAHPYQQIALTVTYTAPSGEVLTCYGFWDGGSTFRIRFLFPAPGIWTWKTACSDMSNTGLHEQSGTVNVVEYAGDNSLYRHGYLKVSDNRRYLVHADGLPFLWIGDTPWSVFVTATQEEWERYLQNRRDN